MSRDWSGIRIGITSGPTRAWFDPVRYLANASTGKLGSLIADRFAAAGATVEYVVGPGGEHPQAPGVQCHEVESVPDLMECLANLSRKRVDPPFALWFHSMAVLDYAPVITSTHKIASSESHLHLTLQQTPKVISHFRAWFPGAWLVGFKLLYPTNPQQLRNAAERLAFQNGCHLVVANGAPFSDPNNHEAYLLEVDTEEWKGPVVGKPSIAEELFLWAERKLPFDVVS